MTTRSAAILLACTAVLPTIALAAPTDILSSTDRFVPPERPMVLTRTLRRPLPDGKEIITLRSYLLRFTRDGERIRIDGDLLAVTVEAPPVLRAMADLERTRPDSGMFPMWLDSEGMLLPGKPAPASSARTAAVDNTLLQIDALPLPASDKAQAQRFAARFRGAGGGTPWPRDLFHPATGYREEARPVPLPDGGQGRITVTAQVTAADGLLETYARRITTEMGSDTRVSIEEWALVAAPNRDGIILPSR